MNGARLAFGARLRAHRERRGISLESIAESTKIQKSFLAGLERSDVSQWPLGLYRRAYLRDYANAIGLPAEPLLVEFEQLFPEPGTSAPEAPKVPVALRITLALDPEVQRRQIVSHITGAALEAVAVLVLGGLAALVGGLSFWTAVGVAALVYYPVATACTGRTLGRVQLETLTSGRFLRALGASARSADPKRLYLVPAPAERPRDKENEFPQRQAATS